MDNQETLSQKYRLGRKLGEGAFATVFLCRRINDGQAYAAKLMNFKENRRLRWEAENEIEVKIVLEISVMISVFLYFF